MSQWDNPSLTSNFLFDIARGNVKTGLYKNPRVYE